METIILPRPKTTAELLDAVRTHHAAIAALVGGFSWNSNEAERHADSVEQALTDVLDWCESAARYEDAYNDAAENEAERIHPFLASERVP